MRRPATPHFRLARLVLALVCLACTGAFAAARGAVRPDAMGGAGWMATTTDHLVVAARTSGALGLLRDGRRADAGAEAGRSGPGGPPYAAPRFLLPVGAIAPHAEIPRATARRSPSRNRAPYDATAPPALP